MKISILIIALFISSLGYGQTTAEEYFDKGFAKVSLEDYRGAIADFNEAIELSGNYSEAYFFRGLSKNQIENYQEAIADFNKAIQFEPTNAWAYCHRGQSKFYLEDYRGAITDYTKALKIHPLPFGLMRVAYFNIALSKFHLKDYQEAIVDFTAAIELAGDYSPDGYLYRGISKIRLGYKDEGCMDLSKAGELGNVDAYKMIKEHCNK